ncbi:potassium transporter KtrA [Microbacterium mangrovi]|uniref:Potassium-transporting ATPase KdpC subunit n=1 Tax=Microbacterium mangrovi TaxID=1348253 RepID=A0A0B1ZXX7_9MICO|nr:potassium-transporting ATPase subunit KdpC [Microbacterium mangrovi]KHK96080.1 potassium transporter KtrA [Microbacterium mangrovi]
MSVSHGARSTWRATGVALRAMIVATLVLGVGYTLVVTGVGQLALNGQANGSTVQDAAGRTIGSILIAQPFTDKQGKPLPQYFQERPSAGAYAGTASGGSNLGPTNPDLVKQIRERKAAVAALEGVPVSEVPADAVTASASGLDPAISPAYAAIQVHRVAEARGMTDAAVRALVARYTTGRDLGFLGEPRVNVLQLNLALDAAGR